MNTESYPQPIRELIAAFRELPGIGQRTAERLVISLLDWQPEKLQAFGRRIESLQKQVSYCKQCGNYAAGETCAVCADARRDRNVLCVVEQASQIPVIEQSASFNGLYHVLGGRIQPLEENRGPEELRIDQLVERVQTENVAEVIIATGSDIEGEATATYVAEAVRPYGVRTSRIATGLPVGADLSYADAATISTAIRGRQDLRRD